MMEGITAEQVKKTIQRIPGFPAIIGPFGFTDLRASLTWSLVDVPSLA